MLCEKCKEREATIHITKIINGEKKEFYLCENCAKENGETFDLSFPTMNMSQFFSSIFGNTNNFVASEKTEIKCPDCGMTYSRFKKEGKMGCSKCYEIFNDNMKTLLRQIHGSHNHIGKIPERAGSNIKIKNQIRELKEELKKAVEAEDYLKAAEIKNKIVEIENQEGGN